MQGILDDFRKGEKMNKKVYCEVCGEEFQARNSNHKCCDNCNQKSIMSEHLRTCKICGGKIKSNNVKRICTKCQKKNSGRKKKTSNDPLVLFEFERRAYNAEHGTKLSYGMYRAYKERGWLK